MSKIIEALSELKLHHTSLARGYVSRKNKSGDIMLYNGRFGKGVKVYTSNPDSTRFCFVTYYVN